MGIIKKIGYAAVLYAAVKVGSFTYNTYDAWKDKGARPFVNYVTSVVTEKAGNKIEDLGVYIKKLNTDDKKKDNQDNKPSNLEKAVKNSD